MDTHTVPVQVGHTAHNGRGRGPAVKSSGQAPQDRPHPLCREEVEVQTEEEFLNGVHHEREDLSTTWGRRWEEGGREGRQVRGLRDTVLHAPSQTYPCPSTACNTCKASCLWAELRSWSATLLTR